ncbi:MAG TPA: DUF1566 domain-containing protein [Gammaproteobacteria bacterium]
MTRRCAIALSIGTLFILPGISLGALIDRGGGLIYDTDLNVTWLADANYAETSGYDADGLMNWGQAAEWAANLSYYDTVRDITWNDWRLPVTLQPDSSCNVQTAGGSFGYGANCTGSELGHLFYVGLGGTAPDPITENHNADFALFSNVQAGGYWSGTELPYYPEDPLFEEAWRFSMGSGIQLNELKAIAYNVWAVRDGDVAAVPVPPAVWLLGSGLLGLMGASRKKTF